MRGPRFVAFLACLAVAPCAAAPAQDTHGIEIVGPTGQATTLTPAALAQLPAVQVDVSFLAEQTTRHASFEGPLLWTVLDHAHAVDPSRPRAQAHQIVLVSGSDRYSAALAVGEISPAFEGKQVILAERMDGKPLDPEHFRIVVPGDKRGARGVRDVIRIVVVAPHGS